MKLYYQRINTSDLRALLDNRSIKDGEYYIQITKNGKKTKPYRGHGGRFLKKKEIDSFKNQYLGIYKLEVLPGFVSL